MNLLKWGWGMMGNEFMKELERLLGKLPKEDRQEILYDYKEHLLIGMENGRTEKEILQEFGDPRLIAKDLMAEYRITEAEKNKNLPNVWRALLAAVSLSFLNLIFIVGPFIGIIGIYISLCAVSLALLLAPVGIYLPGFILTFDDAWMKFFLALIFLSLGILLSIGMMGLGKFIANISLKYIKFNIQLVKGDQSL